MTFDHDRWAALTRAADDPSRGPGRDRGLQLAVACGLEVAPATVGCSLTRTGGDGPRTIAADGAHVRSLDEAQYLAGRGPCLTAATDDVTVRLDLVGAGDGYPEFASAALLADVRSSLSEPVGRGTSLNLYAVDAGVFAEGTRGATVADLLVRCVRAVLAGAAPAPSPTGQAETSRSRETVEAALRVLVARGLTRADAFAELAARAQGSHRTVMDVAQDVVAQEGASS